MIFYMGTIGFVDLLRYAIEEVRLAKVRDL